MSQDRDISSGPRIARHASGAPWEDQVGYCRAVKAGPFIHISGTAPINPDGSCFAPGDVEAQTAKCLDLIGDALGRFGARYADVMRTRLFVRNAEDWPAIGRAHRAVFAEHPPATSLIEIARLIDPDMLIEIEADAYHPGASA